MGPAPPTRVRARTIEVRARERASERVVWPTVFLQAWPDGLAWWPTVFLHAWPDGRATWPTVFFRAGPDGLACASGEARPRIHLFAPRPRASAQASDGLAHLRVEAAKTRQVHPRRVEPASASDAAPHRPHRHTHARERASEGGPVCPLRERPPRHVYFFRGRPASDRGTVPRRANERTNARRLAYPRRRVGPARMSYLRWQVGPVSERLVYLRRRVGPASDVASGVATSARTSVRGLVGHRAVIPAQLVGHRAVIPALQLVGHRAVNPAATRAASDVARV